MSGTQKLDFGHRTRHLPYFHAGLQTHQMNESEVGAGMAVDGAWIRFSA